jgi:hypothetical protein
MKKVIFLPKRNQQKNKLRFHPSQQNLKPQRSSKNLLKRLLKNPPILLYSQKPKRKIPSSMKMNKRRTLLLNQKLNHQSKRKVKNKKRNHRFLETMKMMIQPLNRSQSP